MQVETLQEQIQQLTNQKDNAVSRLQSSEEQNEQHQQSLNTLQQVLRDFRKGQDRDIADATERERNKLRQQEEWNAQLNTQIKSLQVSK